MDNWAPYYIARVKAETRRHLEVGGRMGRPEIENGGDAPYTNMPDDVKKLAEETEAAITEGKLFPFKCPVVARTARKLSARRRPSGRRPGARHELLRQGHRRQDSREVGPASKARYFRDYRVRSAAPGPFFHALPHPEERPRRQVYAACVDLAAAASRRMATGLHGSRRRKRASSP